MKMAAARGRAEGKLIELQVWLEMVMNRDDVPEEIKTLAKDHVAGIDEIRNENGFPRPKSAQAISFFGTCDHCANDLERVLEEGMHGGEIMVRCIMQSSDQCNQGEWVRIMDLV